MAWILFLKQSPLFPASTFTRRVLTLAVLTVMACGVDRHDAPTSIASPRIVSLSTTDTLAPLYGMDNPRRIPGRYIVRFKASVSNSRAHATTIAAQMQGKVRIVFDSLKGFSAELPDSAIERLRRHPNVEYIEADQSLSMAGVGDTTQSGARWPLDRIDQRSLPRDGNYEYSVTGAGVRIWIVDSGVDPSAADLQGRVDQNSYFTVLGQNPFAPCSSHGTGVAISAAGRVNGVAKAATITVARVADGSCASAVENVAAAFEFIANYSSRPAVINFSAGAPGSSPTMEDGVRYAANHGVAVVVAAGNDNINACDVTPAKVAEAITVGATNELDQRSSYSNWSSNWGSCVDLFAPVESTGGTSNAAPLVAGYAALLLQLSPGASPNALMATMNNNATLGALSNIGTGSPNRLLYVKQPPLAVTISGPSTIGPQQACSWIGQESGGQLPYQASWRRDGVVVSTAFSYSVTEGGYSPFTLELTITDGVGRTAWSYKNISIDTNNTSFTCP